MDGNRKAEIMRDDNPKKQEETSGMMQELNELDADFGELSISVKSVYGAFDQAIVGLEERLDSMRELAEEPIEDIEVMKRIVEKLSNEVMDSRRRCGELLSNIRKRLKDSPVRKSEEIDALLDMIRAVNMEIDTGKLQNLVMDIAIKVTNAERGFLLLAEDDNRELTFCVARNMNSTDLDDPEFEISRKIVGEVLSGETAVNVNDAISDTRFDAQQSILKLKLRSILAVPLKHQGIIIGLIYLDNRKAAGIFSTEDSMLLERLAGQMALAVVKAKEVDRLRKSRENLISELRSRYRFDGIITVSEEMHDALKMVGQVASTDVTVLILGKSGTGKELVAKALHANSDRVSHPFVFVNCAAIPEHLLESELFGYEKGAFTGAIHSRKGKIQSAHRGTLFLDEIGDMAPHLQAKILRALQEKVVEPLGSDRPVPVDIRLVAATNRDIEKMVRTGEFREDLYYRLNVITIFLPPLVERTKDIPILIDYFIERFCTEQGKQLISVTGEFTDRLTNYRFPGNVRELENIMLRTVALTESGKTAGAELLPDKILQSSGGKGSSTLKLEPPDTADEYKVVKEQLLRDFSSRLDSEFLLKILKTAGGNMSRAARNARMPRRQLYRMVESAGIPAVKLRKLAGRGDGEND